MSYNIVKFGPITATSSLNVSGNTTLLSTTTVGSSLNVSGNTTINGTTVITGNTILLTATTVGSSLNVSGNATLLSATTVGSSLNVSGNTNLLSTTTVGSTLNVSGNTTINGITVRSSLNVSGSTILQGSVSTNSLFVNDFAIVKLSGQNSNKKLVIWDGNPNESVTSGTQFQGFGTNIGTLRYQTPISDRHAFFKSSSSIPDGTVELGSLTTNSSLNVSGTTTLLNVTTVGSRLNISGTTTLFSATTVGSTLNVSGSTTLLSVTTIGSTLNVSGIANFDSQANALGGVLNNSEIIDGPLGNASITNFENYCTSSSLVYSPVDTDKVVMSSDGKYQLTIRKIGNNVPSTDNPLISTDYGKTWNGVPTISGFGGEIISTNIGMSGSGKYQYVFCYSTSGSTGLWRSSDYGTTWNKSNNYASGIAVSSTGKYVLIVWPNSFYLSSDYGLNFTSFSLTSAGYVNGTGPGNCAMSSSGQIMVIGNSGGKIFLSNNFGKSWSSYTLPTTSNNPVSISGNGQYILTGNYLSVNYGASFNATYGINSNRDLLSSKNISYTAISSNGQYQIITISNGGFWVSSDYGNNWEEKFNTRTYSYVSMSSTGRIVSLASTNGIYVSYNYSDEITERLKYNTTVGSSLNVSGNTTLFGASTVGSSLNVSGNTTLLSETTVGSTLNVSGNTTLFGASTVGSTLNVSGTTTLFGASTVGSSLNVSGSTTLFGASTVGSTLNVSGTTFINGNLTVNSNINFTGNLYQNGILFTGGPDLSNPTTALSSFNVSGKTILNNITTVGSSLNVSGNTILNNITTIGSTLNVSGTTLLNSAMTVSGLITARAFRETAVLNINITGTTILDCSTSSSFIYTLNGNWNITGITGMETSGSILTNINLYLKQGTVGSAIVTWPSSVKWGTFGFPTLSTTPGLTDIVSLSMYDSNNIFGFLSGKGF